MLHWIWEAIVGLVVGALAKLIMPGKDPGGIWITMALGVAGSLLATLLGKAVGWYGEGEAAGFFMSLIGAIVLLAIYRFYKSKTAGSALK
ncbi:MAG: GlsB/YeaQ/YmgE family stress response membrane protein [Acidobacteriaceae bacterium]